jgi:hypothetical protein
MLLIQRKALTGERVTHEAGVYPLRNFRLGLSMPRPPIPSQLKTGASNAGRTLADLDITCFVRVCMTDDVNTARQWLWRELTGYAIVDAYQRYFQQIGFGDKTGSRKREMPGSRSVWGCGGFRNA